MREYSMKTTKNTAQTQQAGQRFSRIYVEKAALAYPATQEILGKLETLNPRIIEIEHYAHVFNRPRQNFAAQKLSPALILAVEREKKLYKGTARINSWGQEEFHYNALVRNCVFNCEYCFLQGMHGSAHTLVFVNIEDFMQAAGKVAERAGTVKPITLNISYLSDLLALESLYPFCANWIEFARSRSDTGIEIRTKSDNIHALSHIEPHPRVHLVWSLSPDPIARSVERGTASFQSRLFAASRAAEQGWKIKLCFDPVLAVPNWQDLYPQTIAHTFARISPTAVEQVSYGVFRMNSDYHKHMRSRHMRSRKIQGSEQVHSSKGLSSYPPRLIHEIRSHIHAELSKYLPPEKIHFVHG